MARAQANRSPALIASALFHAGVVAATLVAWPWLSKDVQFGKVVPVTLVTNGPPAELAPAVQAPTPAPAMASAPTPEAPPQPAPISSAPPTPAAAASSPKTAAPAKPNQAKPSPTKPGLNLDDLMASLSSSPRASTPQTSGKAGPNQARADPSASNSHGTDDHMSASEIGALSDKLSKLWNPNCQVEAAAGIDIKVRITLTPQGFLAATPELVDRGNIQSSGDALLIAAAQRALSAVKRGEPYTDVLKPEHYAGWRVLNVHFNAKQACAKP